MLKHLLLITICVLTVLLPGCRDQFTPEQRWLAFATATISAGYNDLAQQTRKLEEQTFLFCSKPDADGLEQTRLQWQLTMASWQRVQWAQVGPITRDNDDWKLQFWPDRKNLLQRKVQELLRQDEPITVDSLASASVVVQGFSAQELLLFDARFATLERFRDQPRQCQLLQASSSLTYRVSQQLASAWLDTAVLDEWFDPAELRDDASATRVRTGQLIDLLLAHVEKMKNDKLGEPMGLKNRDRKPNGYFAESWRSDHSLTSLQHNLLALHNLTRPQEGYGLYDCLVDLQQLPVAEQLLARIDAAQRALRLVQPPLSLAVQDANQRPQLQAAHQAMAALASVIKQSLAPALGVVLGFNSNDGD